LPTQFHTLPATNCSIIAGKMPGYLSVATGLGQDYIDDDDGLGILWFMSGAPSPLPSSLDHRFRLGFSSPSTKIVAVFSVLFFTASPSHCPSRWVRKALAEWLMGFSLFQLGIMSIAIVPGPYHTHFVSQSVRLKANWSDIRRGMGTLKFNGLDYYNAPVINIGTTFYFKDTLFNRWLKRAPTF